MTYQPYLSGRAVDAGLPPAPPPAQPPSLRNSVRLMYLGAGVAVAGAITAVALSGKLTTEIFNRERANSRSAIDAYTIGQLHTIANVTFVILVVAGLISALLWVWMAWANNGARGWARICASVFFIGMTIEAAVSPSEANVPLVSIVFLLLEWLLGLIAVVLLWRRETSAYIGPG